MTHRGAATVAAPNGPPQWPVAAVPRAPRPDTALGARPGSCMVPDSLAADDETTRTDALRRRAEKEARRRAQEAATRRRYDPDPGVLEPCPYCERPIVRPVDLPRRPRSRRRGDLSGGPFAAEAFAVMAARAAGADPERRDVSIGEPSRLREWRAWRLRSGRARSRGRCRSFVWTILSWPMTIGAGSRR